MKVLITGTGGMGAHISKVLIDNNVDTSLYGTCRQTEAISKIVDIDKIEMHKGDILDAAKSNPLSKIMILIISFILLDLVPLNVEIMIMQMNLKPEFVFILWVQIIFLKLLVNLA